MRASIFAILSALVPLCFASIKIRIPKQVRVTVERFEDADGNVKVGRKYAIGYYERPLDDGDDYYRTVQCGVVDLDVKVVLRCDCRPPGTTRDDDSAQRDTAISVSYHLFLYVDDDDRRATYFSAAVNGDVVVRRDSGTASVPGDWFGRNDGLIGPNRPRGMDQPPMTGDERRSSTWRTTRDGGAARQVQPVVQAATEKTIDAVDERVFKEWLRREFSDDRVFGAAAAATGPDAGGNVGRPMGTFGRDPPCVELPANGDYRDSLPATGCYRLFGDGRCTGVSKMLFWRAENVNEDGAFVSAPVEYESPFRVVSMTGCCRPRREQFLGGDGDGGELVWSTSFSADGDFLRSQNNDLSGCDCVPLENTSTKLSADTAPASSSSDAVVVPSTGADILTETTDEPLSDHSMEPLANNKTENKILTESLSSAIDDSTRTAPTSSSSDPVVLLASTDTLIEPIDEHREESNDTADPSASIEMKYKVPSESSSSTITDDSTRAAPISLSSDPVVLLANTVTMTEPIDEHREESNDTADPSASVEMKYKVPSESSSSTITDDSTRAAPISLSSDPVVLLASIDTLTEPINEHREESNDTAKPSTSDQTKNKIPTDFLPNTIVNDSTTSTNLDSSGSTTSEPSTSTDTPEPLTTTVFVSTIDLSADSRTEKSEESTDDSDTTSREKDETSIVPTIVDGAKEAMYMTWNFLISFSQKLLTSAWFAYKTVQRSWANNSDSA